MPNTALLDTVTEPAIAVEGELDASNWLLSSRPSVGAAPSDAWRVRFSNSIRGLANRKRRNRDLRPAAPTMLLSADGLKPSFLARIARSSADRRAP